MRSCIKRFGKGTAWKRKRQSVIAVPVVCFWVVIAACLMGIAIGSFHDFSISEMLADKTDLGAFFATYGSCFSYALYPAAGACLFTGLRRKGERFHVLAWILLVLGFFMAVYYSDSYNGKAVRELFGYSAGNSSSVLSVLNWLFWIVFLGAVCHDAPAG